MSDDKVFVDANILVYAYDTDAGRKHDIAKSRLKELWQTEQGRVSTQVLQEFYVTVTRKLPKSLSKRKASEVIRTYDAWNVYRPTVHDIIAASELEERHHLSFWDAMIIVAARMSGATRLLSEDMQDGQLLGGVTITNPFNF